jgi:hypothetical protein
MEEMRSDQLMKQTTVATEEKGKVEARGEGWRGKAKKPK